MKTKVNDILKRKDIWVKILITISLLMLFRFGSLLTVPGVTINEAENFEDESFFQLMNLLGGGAMQYVSLFALGVAPYITASIIIQLLSADVIPSLSRMKQQGQKGRVKLEKITRLTSIFIAIIQALAITFALEASGYITLTTDTDRWLVIMILTIIFVAGSLVSLWIADLITLKGVGNGTSLIIFTGIVSTMPMKVFSAYDWMIGSETDPSKIFLGALQFIAYLGVFLVVILFVAFFSESERKLPIQQTGKGLNLGESNISYIPFKVNPSGIVPVIFATAIITLPPTIASLFPTSEAQLTVLEIFSLSHPFGLTLFGLLIFAFTFFYAHISLDPEKLAGNLKKSNTFILGIKPGKDTEKYLRKTINNLCFFGATYLTFIAILPYLLGFVLPSSITIGGTQIIIVVSVAIETVSEIKGRFRSQKTTNKLRSNFSIRSLQDGNDDRNEKQEKPKAILW